MLSFKCPVCLLSRGCVASSSGGAEATELNPLTFSRSPTKGHPLRVTVCDVCRQRIMPMMVLMRMDTCRVRRLRATPGSPLKGQGGAQRDAPVILELGSLHAMSESRPLPPVSK